MKFTPVKSFDEFTAGQNYTAKPEDEQQVRAWIQEGKVREVFGADGTDAQQADRKGAQADQRKGADQQANQRAAQQRTSQQTDAQDTGGVKEQFVERDGVTGAERTVDKPAPQPDDKSTQKK